MHFGKKNLYIEFYIDKGICTMFIGVILRITRLRLFAFIRTPSVLL